MSGKLWGSSNSERPPAVRDAVRSSSPGVSDDTQDWSKLIPVPLILRIQVAFRRRLRRMRELKLDDELLKLDAESARKWSTKFEDGIMGRQIELQQPDQPEKYNQAHEFHVYCSKHNKGAEELAAELNKEFTSRLKNRISVSTDEKKRDKCAIFLLVLNGQTWEKIAKNEEDRRQQRCISVAERQRSVQGERRRIGALVEELEEALKKKGERRMKILPVLEAPTHADHGRWYYEDPERQRHPRTMKQIFEATHKVTNGYKLTGNLVPGDNGMLSADISDGLIDKGIYDRIALPLSAGTRSRPMSLKLFAEELARVHAEKPSNGGERRRFGHQSSKYGRLRVSLPDTGVTIYDDGRSRGNSHVEATPLDNGDAQQSSHEMETEHPSLVATAVRICSESVSHMRRVSGAAIRRSSIPPELPLVTRPA